MQAQIDVNTLRDMLERGEPVTMLDVRHADEWAEWTIPGSLNADVYDGLKANDPEAMTGVELPADRPIITL